MENETVNMPVDTPVVDTPVVDTPVVDTPVGEFVGKKISGRLIISESLVDLNGSLVTQVMDEDCSTHFIDINDLSLIED